MDKPVRDGNPRTAREGGPFAAQRRRPVVALLLLFLALALVLDGVAGERGWLANRRAQQQYDQEARALEQARWTNALLREEARRLLEDPDAIEDAARQELGLIKPGEKLFIVRDVPKPTEKRGK
jgi:cell division protein FtsB